MFKLRDRRDSLLLNRPMECANTADALAEAGGSVRSLLHRNAALLDPRGRVDVEDEGGHLVARLLLTEELKAL